MSELMTALHEVAVAALGILALVGIIITYLVLHFHISAERKSTRERDRHKTRPSIDIGKISRDKNLIIIGKSNFGKIENIEDKVSAKGILMEQILADLGSIASIASLLLQGATVSRQENGSSVVSLRNEPPLTARNELVKAGRNLARVIDADLLKVFEELIRRATLEFYERLKKAESAQGRDAADGKAQREICDLLNRIKDRNNGKLPGDYFKKLWKSFKCVNQFE